MVPSGSITKPPSVAVRFASASRQEDLVRDWDLAQDLGGDVHARDCSPYALADRLGPGALRQPVRPPGEPPVLRHAPLRVDLEEGLDRLERPRSQVGFSLGNRRHLDAADVFVAHRRPMTTTPASTMPIPTHCVGRSRSPSQPTPKNTVMMGAKLPARPTSHAIEPSSPMENAT